MGFSSVAMVAQHDLTVGQEGVAVTCVNHPSEHNAYAYDDFMRKMMVRSLQAKASTSRPSGQSYNVSLSTAEEIDSHNSRGGTFTKDLAWVSSVSLNGGTTGEIVSRVRLGGCVPGRRIINASASPGAGIGQ